jgi:hypothetical protein
MPGAWQLSTNQDQRVGTDTETVTINLSKANFLSEVHLRINATNGATSNVVIAGDQLTVENAVSRIEVLGNGAQLKNYRGFECIKWAKYLRGDKPGCDKTETAAGVQFQQFPIFFNRFTGDELCMLPAKLFKTLTLRWTNTFAVSATAGYATGTVRADVIEEEWVSDDQPNSKIILRETEVTQYTTLAAGAARVPAGGLPLGNLITKVLLHNYIRNVEDGVDISYVRLGINNMSEIPFGSIRWVALQDKNRTDCSMPDDQYTATLMLKNADTVDIRLGRIKSVLVSCGIALNISEITAVSGDTLTIAQSDVATPTAVTAVQPQRIIATSAAPVAYCVLLDLDKRKDFSGGIRSNLVNSVDLEVTNAGAGALCVVSMQEAITIPAA